MYKEKRFNIVYRITNKTNGKLYIGTHRTNNIDDSYMGSGRALHAAYEKYGIENFEKEIISFHQNAEEMLEEEKRIVTRDFISRKDTYNMAPGGYGGFIYHTSDGLRRISESRKDKIMALDFDGNAITIDKNDIRWKSGELVGITKGKTVAKDNDGNRLVVDKNDPRFLTKDLVGHTKGLVSVKDKDGNTFSVSKDDDRLETGELVGVTKGSTQSVESNKKRSDTLKGVKKPLPRYACSVCGTITTSTNLIRWHTSCNRTQ
jgi:hypothetical protein